MFYGISSRETSLCKINEVTLTNKASKGSIILSVSIKKDDGTGKTDIQIQVVDGN